MLRITPTRALCFGAVLGALLIAPASASATSLLSNGDFESGNLGFTSDYAFKGPEVIGGGAQYTVTTDPKLNHPGAASYGDHTSGSGKMMAVNGSGTAGDVVWGVSDIAVEANTLYDFAAYLSSWYWESPAELEFSINGASIGTLTASATTGVWELFNANWNSGDATTANIAIVNTNTALGGNDFALDDLYFGLAENSPSNVPEPGSLALALLGMGALAFRRRRAA